jgi:hypothetical protein
MLNTMPKIHAFVILLVCGALFFPACGKKTEVKSQTVSETVLNAAATPVASVTPQTSANVSMPAEKADSMVKADTEEDQIDPTENTEDSETLDEVPMTKAASAPKPAKKAERETVKPVTEASAAAEAVTNAAASSTPEALAQVPADDSSIENVQAPARKKSGLMNAFLWMILIPILIIGLVWFIWSMLHKRELPFQPAPPMGGLSPVSGFTAVKNRMKAESEPRVSFWNKKLF